VPFVEVTLAGVPGQQMSFAWDTHFQNFEAVKSLSTVLDSGWSALMDDLRARGRLQDTLIVWMGEFGRTPKINQSAGRDHFPNAWTTVLAGGGIRGGQAFGKTSDDGTTVKEDPVTVPDFLNTVCHALGIDPTKQNMSDVGRPIRIVDQKSRTIKEVLA
jgi:arylsulfatase A-like enzyme